MKALTLSEFCALEFDNRKRKHPRIELNSDLSEYRGPALDEVWWCGAQWAVTAYGIECLTHNYHVAANQLLDRGCCPEEYWYTWPRHMSGKAWCDVDEFATAWLVALVLHGKAKGLGGKAIEELRDSFRFLSPVGKHGPKKRNAA